MAFLQSLLGKIFSRERRRANRKSSPQLAAFFWTGAAPVEHSIRDISSTGLFLVTEERWYPGTVVMMTLQKRNEPIDSPDRSIAVQSRAVRWGEDGVGLQFVLPEGPDRKQGKNLLEDGADRRSLEKFLEGFQSGNGIARVDRIARPGKQG
jgi:hypothetical protein